MTEKFEKFLLGPMWRSETMVLLQMTMQREAAHDTTEQLGDLGLVEFKDLSAHVNAFQRNYANEVRRCEELERRIRYVEEQLMKAKESHPKLLDVATMSQQQQQQEEEEGVSDVQATLDVMEARFENYEQELRQLNDTLEQLEHEKVNNQEMQYVIGHGEKIFKLATAEDAGDVLPAVDEGAENVLASVDQQDMYDSIAVNDEAPPPPDANTQTGSLGYLTGVIAREKVPAFQLLLYRATRGNVIPRFSEIEETLEDTRTGKKVEKNVFIVFFGANRAREKVQKICESLGASVHDFPERNASQKLGHVVQQINDLENTISSTNERKNDILAEIAIHIDAWKKRIAKEKAIYDTMNMFDYSIGNSVVAEGWCPKKAVDSVVQRMKDAEESSNAMVESFCEELHTDEVPPTYNETNEFTECIQNIVDSYGIPRYKEANPALPSMVTFPFLFAVMFSDFGHGVLLTLFALAMVLFQGKLKRVAEQEELFGMIFYGRYVILLMGLFTMFTGIMYNDAFGHQFEVFGSTAYDFDPTTFVGEKVRGTYPIGVDPAWYETDNKLDYFNSLKMKMSIVFGVAHMMLGIFMSFCNRIQYRRYFSIFAETIPEVLILGCTFGYLSFMILYKWCVPWFDLQKQPPSLLNAMTDFFLSPWAMKEPPLYDSQVAVQIILLLLAAISIPWLFLPMPIYEIITHKLKSRKHRYFVDKHEEGGEHLSPIMSSQDIHGDHKGDEDEDHAEYAEDMKISFEKQNVHGDIALGTIETSPRLGDTKPEHEHQVEEVPAEMRKSGEGEEEEGEEFIASEIVIQQMIHTIEYALGAVSNTASYLRLWALSLAHAQLSEVFWNMTWGIVFTMIPYDQLPWIVNALIVFVGIFILFNLWFMMTIGVLLCLECLSAFLHSLRLHWVEFQTKFYLGDGRAFSAFDLKLIVKEAAVKMKN